MSLYFDGFFACDLKRDTPEQVIETLQYMTRDKDYDFTNMPDDDFFKTEGWQDFLVPDYREAPGWIGSELRKMPEYAIGLDAPSSYYSISFRRTMHDDTECYVHWFNFLGWIAPYSATTGFVGYYREIYDLHPRLVYIKSGKPFFLAVDGLPVGINNELWNNSTP